MTRLSEILKELATIADQLKSGGTEDEIDSLTSRQSMIEDELNEYGDE